MRYSTIVEKSEEALNLIIEKAMEFDQERVIDGLQVRHYSVDDVLMLTSLVEEYHGKLRKEIVALVKFSQNFNSQYATDNNKCFDTASRLFNRLRSSIAGTKKLYKKFCPLLRRKGPCCNGQEQRPSVFTHSMLNVHQTLLFGFEGYDACAEELYHTMEEFFGDLVVGLKLCRDVMQQEREIRGDYPRLLGIYESCCERVVNESRGLIQTLEQYRDLTMDDVTLRKSAARSMQQFVCDGFHTYDKSQFQMHAVMDAISKGRRNGLTEVESVLWNNNREFVTKVRLVISRLDDLEPRGMKDRTTGRYKLSAKVVAMLMKWCGITGSGKEQQFVEEYFNKNYKGKYQTIGSSGVNSAKNKFTNMEYTNFCFALSEISSPDYKAKPKLKIVD